MSERWLEDRWRLIHRVRSFEDPEDIDDDYLSHFHVLWTGEDLPDSSAMEYVMIRSMVMAKTPAFVPDGFRFSNHEGLILQQKKLLKVGRGVFKAIWLDAGDDPEDY
jgi:hypothetical protein